MLRKVLLLGILPIFAVCLLITVRPPSSTELLESKNLSLRLPNEKEAKRPDKPAEAMAYWAELHETPNGEAPSELNQRAAQESERDRAKRSSHQLVPFRFEALGPGNFAGRIRGLVVNPADPETLLAGSVSGGIWKTTNGGKFWKPTFSFEPSVAIGHLLVDSDSPNRVFAGTGEGFQNGGAMQGLGIFVSEDFGDSWNKLDSTQNESFYYVNRLAKIPGTQTLLAATSSGLYRSTDLGQSWEDVDGISIVTSRGFVDVKVNPANPNIAIASYYGQITSGDNSRNYLMRSTDGGQTWARIRQESGITTFDIGRHELAFASDGTLYVAISDNTSIGRTNGLYKSTDGGQSFAKTASTTAFIERQGWYDLMVAVDPSDSSRVYMGAIDVFRTTNGGTTINKISEWFPGQGQIPIFVHADIHTLTFHPTDPKTFWIGCDGGVFKSTNGGDSFESVNGNLSITQFYGMAVHPEGTQAIGGTQDNGTIYYYQDKVTWLEWVGGDGGFAAWDQQDPRFIYGSTPNGGMFGSNMSIGGIAQVVLPTTNGAPFIQPFTLDPNDGNRMLVGTNTLFFTANIRNLTSATWQTTPTTINRPIRSTTISPHDGKIAFAGDATGRIYRTTDLGGANMFDNILSQNFGVADVTWVEVDPNDSSSQTLYATLADYQDDRVVMTQDGGATWRSLQGNLPQVPFFCVRVDPKNPKRLFAGSEIGLWTTADATLADPVWERYAFGTAYTRILQLHWSDGGDTLWLATYGRGIIQAKRDPIEVRFATGTEPKGDGDGILDIGERLNLIATLTNASGIDIPDIQASLLAPDPRLEVLAPPMEVANLSASQTSDLSFTISLGDWSEDAGNAELILTLNYLGNSYTHTFTPEVAANPQPRTDSFFDGGEGESLFTQQALIGQDMWTTATSRPRSGDRSWFASNDATYSDKSLVSPWFTVKEAAAKFSFWLAYDLEGDNNQRWDGAVLELRKENGEWTDVGNQSGVPYDGQLFKNSSLQFRHAWSGIQTTYRQGQVELGSYVNEKVQFRFRLACDTGSANTGIWVDDIEVTGVQWMAPSTLDLDPCTDCETFKGSNRNFLYVLAEATQTGSQRTMVGIVNPHAGAQQIDIYGFAGNGQVRGIVAREIPGNGKIWADLGTLFPDTFSDIQWVQVGADQALQVFGEMQRPGVRSAYTASASATESVYIPHVGKNTGLFQTYISVVNGLENSSTTQITTSGSVEVDFANPHGAYSKVANTAVGLFGQDLSAVDWAQLSSTQSNLGAMEYFSTLPGETQVASLGLDQNRGTPVRFLHIAKDLNNFWTGIVYFNVSNQTANATETYFDEMGNALEIRDVQIAPSEKITRLFDAATTGNSVPAGAAWMQVDADQDLIGYELFGSPQTSPSDYFVGLQAEYSSGSSLLYPHVESDDLHFTGLVALNLGDQPGDLTFHLYDSSGQLLATQTQAGLAGKTKATLLARQLFPTDLLANGAWIRATSTNSQWAGFLLWGDLSSPGRQNLSGIKAGLE